MIDLKNIEWFIKTYPESDERYWAISEYLMENLNIGNYIPIEIRNKLLDYICQYSIDSIGLDPRKTVFN